MLLVIHCLRKHKRNAQSLSYSEMYMIHQGDNVYDPSNTENKYTDRFPSMEFVCTDLHRPLGFINKKNTGKCT